jgi:hypothetical protein
MKLKPIVVAFVLALPISAYSDINGSDYSEFSFEDLGYGIGLAGDDKSISAYNLSFEISPQGIITGSGTRNDTGGGNSTVFTTSNVTVVDGKLGVPTTQTTSENFVKRISGRNVTLKREVNTKWVGVLVTLSDGGVIKGGWAFNQEREQTAVWRRNAWVYNWKVTEEWYSGQVWAWYGDKTGTGMLGD